jgi:hypothetical protein
MEELKRIINALASVGYTILEFKLSKKFKTGITLEIVPLPKAGTSGDSESIQE